MQFTNAISAGRLTVTQNRWLQAFLVLFFSVWIYTLVDTSNLSNWILENTLTILFMVFLVTTYRYYQFSDLSYLLICVYLCLHVYGAMHTYAENPLGYWLQATFGTARNPYDRIVHFSFGFLLAYPMREVFLNWLKFPVWVSWALPIEITLSVSGLYELIEWAVADVFFPAQGADYLGSQGDIWDAQKDMFLATMGAVLATTIVSVVKKSFKIEKASDGS